jgi:hypothetical protein
MSDKEWNTTSETKPPPKKKAAPRMSQAEIKAKNKAMRPVMGRMPTSYCLGDTYPSNWSRVKLRQLDLSGR